MRIRKASRSFNSLYKVLWRQRGVKVKTKMRICKSVVPPTLLYGSETWTPTATHIRRLQGFMMKCIRVILAVSVRDERRNTELRAVAGMERLEVVLMRRRLRWLSLVVRMGSTRIPKCMLVCKPKGGRHSPGGQNRRWVDVVVGDLKRCEYLQDWRQQTQDRVQWRGQQQRT